MRWFGAIPRRTTPKGHKTFISCTAAHQESRLPIYDSSLRAWRTNARNLRVIAGPGQAAAGDDKAAGDGKSDGDGKAAGDGKSGGDGKTKGKPKKRGSFLRELPGLLIVSQVDLEPAPANALGVRVERASGLKCERCWKYTSDVGADPRFPTVCSSCAGSIDETLNG